MSAVATLKRMSNLNLEARVGFGVSRLAFGYSAAPAALASADQEWSMMRARAVNIAGGDPVRSLGLALSLAGAVAHARQSFMTTRVAVALVLSGG